MKSTLPIIVLYLFLFLNSLQIHSQIELVKDISTVNNTQSSVPRKITASNDLVIYIGSDFDHGKELWSSDGTETGTFLVKDIWSGPVSSEINNLFFYNDKVFFCANTQNEGTEMWVSDGTESGTEIFKIFAPGTDNGIMSGNCVLDGIMYFNISSPNGLDLWKTDGTFLGTQLVKSFEIGSFYEPIRAPIEYNNVLYFSLNDGISGNELWKTDGTEIGTTMLLDINPGQGDSYPYDFEVFNGQLFFSAYDPDNGREIWKTDGTTLGTSLVADLVSGLDDSNPAEFTVCDSTLFFTAGIIVNEARKLWKTDGTAIGTALVKDFSSTNPYEGSPSNLYEYNDTLYLMGYDETAGYELWKSDGTENGTVLVKDIVTGSNSSGPGFFIEFQNELVFWANQKLWKSDGTLTGTVLVTNEPTFAFEQSEALSMLIEANNQLFFAAEDTAGIELWESDGSSSGTAMIADNRRSNCPGIPQYQTSDTDPFLAGNSFLAIDNTLFFTATSSWVVPFTQSFDYELWKSDGTENGTVLVKDINPGEYGSYPSNFTEMDSTLYFITYYQGTTWGIPELWKSNGTETGTELVSELYSTDFNDTLLSSGNYLYFDNNSPDGYEPWVSDGTQIGTHVLKDINTSGDSNPNNFTDVDGTFFFTADDGTHGMELWKSDGTQLGTVLVKDIYTGPNTSNPSHLRSVNGILYFAADDGTNGSELWKSDGSELGTVLVIDLESGASSSNPANMQAYLDGFIFSTLNNLGTQATWYYDEINSDTTLLNNVYSTGFHLFNNEIYYGSGNALWKSDGTPEGTSEIVYPKNPNYPEDVNIMGEIDGKLYFLSNQNILPGGSLWSTDGSICGTNVLQGEKPINVTKKFAIVNDQLLFAAVHPSTDHELYTYNPIALESGVNEYSFFAIPSALNICNGKLAVDIAGNNLYEYNNGPYSISDGANTIGYANNSTVINGLCPGVYDLTITDKCIDTMITVVVPVDSNYIYNNPYYAEYALDSIGSILINCEITYNTIDTAYIENISSVNDTVIDVVWLIVDGNGYHYDTTSYVLYDGNGIYCLQLALYCPTKSSSDFFAVTEIVYFEDGTAYYSGISEENSPQEILIYPNPTNDLVTISFDGNSANYTIFDAQGKRIQTSTILSGGTISLRDVQTGVYFFELKTENGRTVKRVVKN